MGQLEKYGLYVLCLVIFLILGVTIWGGSDAPAPGQTTPAVAINANRTGGAVPANVPATVGGDSRSENPSPGGNFLESLLQPAPRPTPVIDKSRAAGPVDADRNLGGKPDDASVKPKPVAPPAPEYRMYTIRSGDSFGKIAKRELGTATRAGEIARLNPRVDSRKLQIGKQLRLPGKSSGGSSAPSSGDALQRAGAYRTYTIRKGDSFERIARAELGSAKRVGELRKLNPNTDPKRLGIGKKIKLPLK